MKTFDALEENDNLHFVIGCVVISGIALIVANALSHGAVFSGIATAFAAMGEGLAALGAAFIATGPVGWAIAGSIILAVIVGVIIAIALTRKSQQKENLPPVS